MSGDDWAPGDLALCVREAPYPTSWTVKPGTISVVRDVYTSSNWIRIKKHGLVLRFIETSKPECLGECASRFRKIRPLTDEERRAELRDLPVPHPENADA